MSVFQTTNQAGTLAISLFTAFLGLIKHFFSSPTRNNDLRTDSSHMSNEVFFYVIINSVFFKHVNIISHSVISGCSVPVKSFWHEKHELLILHVTVITLEPDFPGYLGVKKLQTKAWWEFQNI